MPLRPIGPAFALCAVILAFSASAAERYPVRPVTIVVPLAPGSGTDTMSRELANELSQRLGQPFVVDNRPTGNAIPATEFVARALPDGYTLFVGGNTTQAANPHLYKSVRYDPLKDFTAIGRLSDAGFVLVVAAHSPVRSVADLVAQARTAPAKLSWSSSNSAGRVSGELLNRVAAIETVHIPARGIPQALTDVLAGSVAYTFVDVSAALSGVNGGLLRALAYTGATRTPRMADLPTMTEQGLAGFDIIAWNALFAPAGLPAEVATALEQATRDAMTDPKMEQRLKSIGLDAFYAPPDELAAFVRSEHAKWGDLIRSAGMAPN